MSTKCGQMHRRLIISSILAVICSLYIFGANAEVALDEFHESTAGFSVLLPVSWTTLRKKDSDSSQYSLIAQRSTDSPDERFRENIFVSIQRHTALTLEEHAQANLDAMRRHLGPFEILEQHDLMIGGVTSKMLLYTFSSDKSVREVLYFGITDSTLFVVRGTTIQERAAEYLPLFERIATSFRINKLRKK